MTVVLTNVGAVTAYGPGLNRLWDGLLDGRSALAATDAFDGRPFLTRWAGLVPGLDPGRGSRVAALLAALEADMRSCAPADAALVLATTVGEIDLLERAVLGGAGNAAASVPEQLLEHVRTAIGVSGPASVVSAACASSTVALARAATAISAGDSDAVLVVGGDAVTEFVFSGFSALMALSPTPARPFDRDRDGLSLGEGAAYALLMSPDRARRERRPALAALTGWGCAGDANHMTGPSRDGVGLALAIKSALQRAGIRPDQVGAVNAHGTGTVYNDAMEMKAFRHIFGGRCLPVHSIKGGTGHTLGAAGLLEVLVATRSLATGLVPPTPGLARPAPDAAGWVSPQAVPAAGLDCILSTNSGFGGVNAALLLRTVP